MKIQNNWLFEAPLIQEKVHSTNSSRIDLPQYESDAMSSRLRGRPKTRLELVRMYHYSPYIIRDAIKVASRWTDIGFGGRSIQTVARFTGLQIDKIKYRYEFILPRRDKDRYFRNVATKFLSGEGVADEYINKIPIHIHWIKQVISMTKL